MDSCAWEHPTRVLKKGGFVFRALQEVAIRAFIGSRAPTQDCSHKRWRQVSRAPTVWQPFPPTDGSRYRRRASLKTTWAWMRTPTLRSQTCRRLQRALCRILDAQTLRRIRQPLQESGRSYDIARMDDLEAAAEDHSWPTSIDPARTMASVEWVTRVRIRQGCKFLHNGRICAGSGTKILGTRSLRTRAVLRQRICDERTQNNEQINKLASILTVDPHQRLRLMASCRVRPSFDQRMFCLAPPTPRRSLPLTSRLQLWMQV